MKKFKVVALGVAMVAAMTLAGCSKKQAAAPAAQASKEVAGWKANADKPIKFDWYINFSWFARHWGDSKVSKYITQKTGVDVNFIVPVAYTVEQGNCCKYRHR